MDNPNVRQIIKIIKNKNNFVFVHKGEDVHYLECSKVIELFGNLEVKDICFYFSFDSANISAYKGPKIEWGIFI